MDLLRVPRGEQLLSVHHLPRELHHTPIREYYLRILQLHKEPTHSRQHDHLIQLLHVQFGHQFYGLRMAASPISKTSKPGTVTTDSFAASCF